MIRGIIACLLLLVLYFFCTIQGIPVFEAFNQQISFVNPLWALFNIPLTTIAGFTIVPNHLVLLFAGICFALGMLGKD
jgi:hypothetical protein